MRELSFVLLAIAFATGISLAGLPGWNLQYLYVGAGCCCAVILAVIGRKTAYAAALLVALFLLIGMIRLLQDDVVAVHDTSRFFGQRVILSGRVADAPQIVRIDEELKVRYLVAAESIQTGGISLPSTGKVIVSVHQSLTDPVGSLDDTIEVTGDLSSLHGYNNPGAIDAVASWKRQGITSRMSVISKNIQIITNKHKGWESYIVAWRSSLLTLFHEVMPENDAAILNGVLFGGGYNSIRPDVLRDFAATGIIHILSVSGSHIALLTMVMIWLGDRLRVGAAIKIALAGSVMMIYAVLSGLTPPVIRAVIMGWIALLALLTGRDNHGPSALGAAVLVMLAWKPSLLYDISFQLSVSGTAGLVFLYGRIVNSFRFFPRWAAAGIAVTVAAQAGMLPFLAWYFHSLPVGSILANLLVVPVIEVVIIMGLGACVIALIAVPAAKILLVGCSITIGLAVMMNQAVASIAGLQLYLPPFSVWAGGMYFFLLAWLAGYMVKIPSPAKLVSLWPRHTAAALVLLGALLIGWTWLPRPAEVHFIDVGQGDAALIITPHRRAVLVDTGGTAGDASRFDIGERVVAPYLKHQGVTELDFLILTHGHQDHAGGAAAMAATIVVKNIMIAPEKFSDSIRALLRHRNSGTVIPASSGQTILIDGVTISIIHAAAAVNQQRRSNETSSLIRVAYGGHSFLLTGDLEQRQELQAVTQGFAPATVLKVAHHGARTSSSPQFLQMAKPQYAVISVGANNRFGHPHNDVLQRLAGSGTKVYRTDLQGAILFKSDGRQLTVTPFKP